MTGEYVVHTKAGLDHFDADMAYFIDGTDFAVFVYETRERFYPVFHIRENGDVDGFMGWSDRRVHG